MKLREDADIRIIRQAIYNNHDAGVKGANGKSRQNARAHRFYQRRDGIFRKEPKEMVLKTLLKNEECLCQAHQ